MCAASIALLLAAAAAAEVKDDLQNMSSAELATLEETTLGKVKASEVDLSSLRSEIAVLKRRQMTISEEQDRTQGALQWEENEKKKRDAQLSEAKSELGKKHKDITTMAERVKELKAQIATLQDHLSNLTRLNDKSLQRAKKPSLGEVLDARADRWNEISRNVYKKTKTYVSNGVSGAAAFSEAYRDKVASSPTLDLLATLLIYGFFVLGAFAVQKIYTKVRGQLTIERLLFMGDAFCAGFWAVMLICFCFLWMDPLVAVQKRSPTIFFFFQLSALICYVNFVLLRVLLLASKLSLSALGETLSVVVVGHHYYVRVWQPAMLDQPIHGTFFYYFCYCWLFVAFAYNRVNEFAPLKQLRGEKLPPLTALRVLFKRFTTKGVPDGDLESRPFVDIGSDDDDHQS